MSARVGSLDRRRRRGSSQWRTQTSWYARFCLTAVGSAVVLFGGVAWAQTGDRGLLWHVVQACVVNTRLTGASFPCLDVDLSKGAETGFAVVRAPLETTHIVVVPTTRVAGVESPRLLEANAANYFQDAWRARHFVEERAPRGLKRDDIGLAINSQPGRSQDQLHIHVDCLQPSVRDALRKHAPDIKTDAWTHLPVVFDGGRYWALRLKSADLADVNIVKLVANGLHVAEEDRAKVTIVLAGASFDPAEEGFYILAALARHQRLWEGHGEVLLNHSCSEY